MDANLKTRRTNTARRSTVAAWSRVVPGGAVTGQREFDAGRTTRVNEKHWAGVGNADVDSLLLPRLATIRNRARHEVFNSGYASGLVETYQNDVVGGYFPALQVTSSSERFNQTVERYWAEWCKICDCSGRLHYNDLLRMHVGLLWTCGEYLQQYTQANAAAERGTDAEKHPVKLRLLSIHPDRLATPVGAIGTKLENGQEVRDGVKVDADGRTLEYYIYRQRPGSVFGATLESDPRPAREICHVFKTVEPGQTRGIPWLAPVLETFAQLRDFIGDTLLAARMAALMAAYVQTNHPDAQLPDASAPLAVMDIEPGTLTELPQGYSVGQVKPEHPGTTFKEFKHEILAEMGRPKGVPYLKIACDAAGHNYSSARLDLQNYWNCVESDQGWIERNNLNRDFAEFFLELRLSSAFLAEAGGVPADFRIEWQWPPIPQIDPSTDEEATQLAITNGTTTLQIECGKRGYDWRKIQAQRAVEQKNAEEIGLGRTSVDAAAAAPQGLNGAQIVAAIDILTKLREQAMIPMAAVEMLTAIGIERARSEAIVNETPIGLDNTAGDVEFKREILKKLLEVPAARESVYNATDIEDLIAQTGLSPEAGYQAPFIPIVAPAGMGLVNGGTIKDAQNDVVGGTVDTTATPAPQQGG